MSKPDRDSLQCDHYLCRLFELSLLLLALIALFWTPKLWAQQCFFDAQLAYQSLIEKQQQAQLAKQNEVININKASEAELTRLKGIGSNKAQQIILYREAFGPFKTVQALAEVKGIGAKTVANNIERMTAD